MSEIERRAGALMLAILGAALLVKGLAWDKALVDGLAHLALLAGTPWVLLAEWRRP